MESIIKDLNEKAAKAVSHYWLTREHQARKQEGSGRADQGLRSAFNRTIRPWLGYIFLLEDCKGSQSAVRVKEPHFSVFEEFRGASYAKRYELFCRKLVRERHYNASAFFLSDRKTGQNGAFREPAEDLTFELYARSLVAQVAAYGKG